MDKHKAKHSPPTFQPCALTQVIRETLWSSHRTWRTVAGLAVAGLVGLSNPAIAAFPASINLADLDGSNGFVINAPSGSVSNAGDVNGDGLDDVIIGNEIGDGYVIFGRQDGFPAAVSPVDLDGSNGFTLNGTTRNVSNAGDVNGDGIDDVIIGAVGTYPYTGEGYVVFGRQGVFPAVIYPTDLDGSNGFVINTTAWSVSDAGDVNGDGIDDVIIGDPSAVEPPFYGGESYIVFGSTTGFPAAINPVDLDGSNGFVINGNTSDNDDGASGTSVSTAGDINGDGVDDVIIGAPFAPSGTYSPDAGRSYVVFGDQAGFPAEISLSDLDGDNGFAILNELGIYDMMGSSVSVAGDVNGDGIDDVIIGSLLGPDYVVFGNQSGFAAIIDVRSLDGSNGFTLFGPGQLFGTSVSAAGDVNGDGIDDMIIGAPYDNAGAGAGYVVFGRQSGFPSVLDVANVNGSNGFVINGIDAYDQVGRSVSAAGDVNGDGIDDVIIGALNVNENYVVFGRRDAAPSFTPVLQSLGDINGDGSQDVAALVHDAAANSLIATVKDAENNSLISTVTFDGSLTPLRFIQLPDINSNGAPELVVLGTGSVKAEVRDSLTGNLLSTVNFNPNITPVDIGVVPDRNGNGIPELAVLGKHPTKGFVNVQTRDALTGNKIASTGFVPSFIPKQLLVLPDVDGNGMPEFAVLAVEDSAEQFIKVEIRNFNGAPVRDIWLDQVSPDPLYMAMLEDMNGNGAVELATLRQKKDWVNVVVNDALSGAKLSSIGYNPNFAPLKLVVMPDLNGNGKAELAVFGKNVNTDGIKAEVRDASSGALIKDVFFWKVFTPQDLVTIPDISGNGKAELGMLGLRLSDGALRAYIKDVVTNTDIINMRF